MVAILLRYCFNVMQYLNKRLEILSIDISFGMGAYQSDRRLHLELHTEKHTSLAYRIPASPS